MDLNLLKKHLKPDNKLGQQDILLKVTALFCEDITITVIDEFENTFEWIIVNGIFKGYEQQKIQK